MSSGGRRSELVRMFVLDVMADDYEDLCKICTEVAALGARCDFTIGRDEIICELSNLITMGFAKAYQLSVEPQQEIFEIHSPGEMERYYYWLTPSGLKVQSAEYDAWPFDGEGHVRQDWLPPKD